MIFDYQGMIKEAEKTGQPVTIKASNTVAFKPGKFLKDSVNP